MALESRKNTKRLPAEQKSFILKSSHLVITVGAQWQQVVSLSQISLSFWKSMLESSTIPVSVVEYP